MLFVAAGGMLVTGLFCSWLSLQQLTQIDRDDAEANAPKPVEKDEEEEEEKPRLTRLGRPIEEIRLN